MPLIKSCSIDALERNIATELRAGRPREQAVAVAQQTLRTACTEAGQPVPLRKTLDVIRKQQTTDVQTILLPKARFKTREAAEAWATEHDFDASRVSESDQTWRVRQRPVSDFIESSLETVPLDADDGIRAVIGRPKTQGITKANRRTRTTEFLEEAFARAQKILNPRDFAVIHQAARSAAGGRIKAKRRKEQLAAGDGRTYVALDGDTKAAKRTRKGFLNRQPEGGMHAHGLDRRNGKTTDDGWHLHAWQIPGTGELIVSDETGSHAHVVDGDATATDGAHSHNVVLPGGAVVETQLGGAHAHQLMVETSGFDGLHTHPLVMPDGTELPSLTPAEFVDKVMQSPPVSQPLPSASVIVSAMQDLRMERESAAPGASLPGLDVAVQMAAKGEVVAPPVFTVEVIAAADDWIECGFPGTGRALAVKNMFDAGVGDMLEMRWDGEVIGYSNRPAPDDIDAMGDAVVRYADILNHTTPIPFDGPADAPLMFVAAAPDSWEGIRKRALVGDDAETFQNLYLSPIGLTRKQVAVGFAMPVRPLGLRTDPEACRAWSEHLVQAMKTHSKAKVIALGRVAKQVLKSAGVEFWSLPHPSVIRKKGDRGEIARKLKVIAKALDAPAPGVRRSNQPQGSAPSDGMAPATLADTISERRKTGRVNCRVIKSVGEKQIVYGVVLDPYDVDLQEDWVPPAEIESTAHGFMKKSRVIGFEHVERAEAQIVESWVEPYPSKADYEAALKNLPHRAFERVFGDDVIHSGAWVAGVQLGDREWELHKQGKLNAFSVGGFSFKSSVTTEAMPKVEFVRLVVDLS